MTKRSQPIATAAQLGAVLQSARKSRKLTQTQLGARLGLSQTRMSELELAPGTLSVEQLLKLCANLGLQLSVQPREDNSASSNAPRTDW
jgi:HTH-type transcriptional regulator/antitoxin HipB